MTHITIDGYHYSRNRHSRAEPYHSMAHALLSAAALAAFVVGVFMWVSA